MIAKKKSATITLKLDRGEVAMMRKLILNTWNVLLAKESMTPSERAFAEQTRGLFSRLNESANKAGWGEGPDVQVAAVDVTEEA